MNVLFNNISEGAAIASNLQEFDQSDFFEISLPAQSSMDNTGYVYIPDGCKDGAITCKLHVALHGCSQGRSVQACQ